MSYGTVKITLRNGKTTEGVLLEFCTIPVPNRDKENEMRVFVYAICETKDGSFVARALNEVKRA